MSHGINIDMDVGNDTIDEVVCLLQKNALPTADLEPARVSFLAMRDSARTVAA
jgi:hypothetical protein